VSTENTPYARERRIAPVVAFRARARDLFFHGRFYGAAIFCCKNAQFHEMQRKSDSLGLPMKNTLRNAVQTCAKLVRPIRNPLL
jgi:hypothetical protein